MKIDKITLLSVLYGGTKDFYAKMAEIGGGTDSDLIALQYDPTESYVAGDVVIHEEKLYEAIDSTTGEFDPTKWNEVNVASLLKESLKLPAELPSSTKLVGIGANGQENVGLGNGFDLLNGNLHLKQTVLWSNSGTVPFEEQTIQVPGIKNYTIVFCVFKAYITTPNYQACVVCVSTPGFVDWYLASRNGIESAQQIAYLQQRTIKINTDETITFGNCIEWQSSGNIVITNASLVPISVIGIG